ncbi:hypothetical protein Ddye_001617 [Dipteronia dyeriana]|uniref:Small auxin up regulated protein n=1 Tax=Dipteronia dyeriana TaxID=168575 RepID=A0AAE0CU58_9ROSI|nr:hypothetical protein Ddye_001617 [Dipteronia dyeriana]
MARKHENLQRKSRAPKGHFVVYVGEEERRFVVPLSYLKNTTFQQLLHKAAEEYGFVSQNRIVLPCDESTFQTLINRIYFVSDQADIGHDDMRSSRLDTTYLFRDS